MDLDQYYQQNNITRIDYNPSYFTNFYDLQIYTIRNEIRYISLIELSIEIRVTLTGYFVDNHNNSLSRQQLSSMINQLQRELNEEKKPTNYLPYILGGMGVVLVIVLLIVFYLLGRDNKKNNYS